MSQLDPSPEEIATEAARLRSLRGTPEGAACEVHAPLPQFFRRCPECGGVIATEDCILCHVRSQPVEGVTVAGEPIATLGLPMRIENACIEHGLHTVQDLKAWLKKPDPWEQLGEWGLTQMRRAVKRWGKR